LIRSQLALCNDIRTAKPLFDSEQKEELIKYPWISAVVISIFTAGLSLLPAALAVLLLSYFLLRLFDKYIKENTGGVTAEIIAGAGTFSELILLLAGVILLVRN
jgi:cobalamin synthase